MVSQYLREIPISYAHRPEVNSDGKNVFKVVNNSPRLGGMLARHARAKDQIEEAGRDERWDLVEVEQ